MGEYIVELPPGPDKSCALDPFLRSLAFVAQTSEFGTAQLQRYLKCGYGRVCKVIDALCSLYVIEISSPPPHLRYKRIWQTSTN